MQSPLRPLPQLPGRFMAALGDQGEKGAREEGTLGARYNPLTIYCFEPPYLRRHRGQMCKAGPLLSGLYCLGAAGAKTSTQSRRLSAALLRRRRAMPVERLSDANAGLGDATGGDSWCLWKRFVGQNTAVVIISIAIVIIIISIIIFVFIVINITI